MSARPLGTLDTLDRLILILAITVIGSTLTLGAFARRGISPLPSETLCVSRNLFGLECAGCGLTRSFVLLGQGDVAESLAMNPLGIAFFLFGCAHVVARLARLAVPEIRSLRRFDLVTGGLLVAVLIVRIIHFYLA